MSWLRTILIAFLAFPLFGATEVAPGIHVIRGGFTPGSQPDGNSIVLDAPEGLVVIDTGRHVAHTQAILDFAKEKGRPVAAVINTHWHLDHIGGNVMMRNAYPAAKIYASGAIAEARTGFMANSRKQLQAMIDDPKTDAETRKAFEAEVRLIDAGEKLAPDVVITSGGSRTIAGRPLRIGLETHAVTAGDVWVLDEKSGVLIAGDLVTLPAPFLDTACPAGWSGSLDHVAALDFDLLIPGHGAPLTRRQFASYRAAYRALVACKGEKEQCIDGWVSAVDALMPGHDVKFTRAVTGYYVDLLRVEPSPLAKYCGASSS